MFESPEQEAAEAVNCNFYAKPILKACRKFLKSLYFDKVTTAPSGSENPLPTVSLSSEAEVRHLDEKTHEVSVELQAIAMQDKKMVFMLEIIYCGVFTLNPTSCPEAERLLLVECPRLLFP